MEAKDNDGTTALEYAEGCGHEHAARLLRGSHLRRAMGMGFLTGPAESIESMYSIEPMASIESTDSFDSMEFRESVDSIE